MRQPLVSIVTPSLNPGARLRRCLRSVAAQTYSNIEHLLIDGGSTDGSLDDLSFSFPSVRVLSEPDHGQSDAINKGFAMSRGEIVGWLNSDDVLTPQAVDLTVAAFESGKEIGWTIGNVIVGTRRSGEIEYPSKVDQPKSWFARNVAAQPGSFYARWALDRVGPLDDRLHYMMDLDLWIRLIDAGIRHEYIYDVLAIFELHENSKSGSESHESFLVDDCAVRSKSGRMEGAAFSLGRAAALRAEERGIPVRQALAEVRKLIPTLEIGRLPSGAIDAGARAETVLIGIKRNWWRAGRLVDLRLWADSRIRLRLVDALLHEFTRPMRRRRAKPYLRFLDGSY